MENNKRDAKKSRMTRAERYEQAAEANGGFAFPLTGDTDLHFAHIIAEDELGNYEPVSIASTLNEAEEIVKSDFDWRMKRLEAGKDPGICPHYYKVFARGVAGNLRIAATFTSHDMSVVIAGSKAVSA